MAKDQETKLDKVAEAVGQDTVNECKRVLFEALIVGDLFDNAAAELTEHRGLPYSMEPDEASQHAYDIAFFDLLEAAIECLRRTWGGYHHTLRPSPPLSPAD